MSVILETSCGEITIDLYVKERPRCCLNFLKLCKIKYYNFSLFHSIQRNLVAQTGDPDGTGKGGKSVFSLLYGDQAAYFEAETLPRIKHKKLGTVSMVNGGNGAHGSQFFITLAPNIDYLDSQNHTVFGEVAESFDVLNTLNETIVDGNNQPYKDVRIFHTVVLDDPFDDPPGLENYIPDRSPSPNPERMKGGRIGVDEEIDDDKGLTVQEVEERRRTKEAKANAQILEMVGDLPDVDVKPPDNVLFVCKLNPVTTSDDLEIIFSRFGTIASCEVIKDQKTQQSLQYAFIEFEKPEDCEKAYFKMDNVLIDDRRIHVDFSQSVSKLKWNPKEKGKPDKKEDDEERTKLRIKHPDDRRKNDKYDLVFEDMDKPEKKQREKGHTKDNHKNRDESRRAHSQEHKKRRQRSSSESPVQRPKHHEHKRRRERSVSKSQDEQLKNKHKHKKRDRSASLSSSERSKNKNNTRERRASHSSTERRKNKNKTRGRSASNSSTERPKIKNKTRGRSASNESTEKLKIKKKDRSVSRSPSKRSKDKHKHKKRERDVSRSPVAKSRAEETAMKRNRSDSESSAERPKKKDKSSRDQGSAKPHVDRSTDKRNKRERSASVSSIDRSRGKEKAVKRNRNDSESSVERPRGKEKATKRNRNDSDLSVERPRGKEKATKTNRNDSESSVERPKKKETNKRDRNRSESPVERSKHSDNSRQDRKVSKEPSETSKHRYHSRDSPERSDGKKSRRRRSSSSSSTEGSKLKHRENRRRSKSPVKHKTK